MKLNAFLNAVGFKNNTGAFSVEPIVSKFIYLTLEVRKLIILWHKLSVSVKNVSSRIAVRFGVL